MNFNQVSELMDKYVTYDMIQLHTELPSYPDIRSRLLFLFLQDEPSTTNRNVLFTLSTSLIQMGLDTHELVSTSNHIKEKTIARSRQLRVLAGDYFSARFYQLLGEAGHLDVILQLSTAICEVNRLKMNFYEMLKKLKFTSSTYTTYRIEMHKKLFDTFTSYLPMSKQQIWQDLLEMFSRCEIHYNEITGAENEFPQKQWKYWHMFEVATKEERKLLEGNSIDVAKYQLLLHKYDIQTALVECFSKQVERLKVTIQLLDNHYFIQELHKIADPFYRLIAQPKICK